MTVGPIYQACLVAHRWLALTLGIFVVVVALSGALLVFEGPILRANQPHVAPTGAPLSLSTLAARARAATGGGSVALVVLSDSPDLAWSFSLGPSAGGRRPVSVVLDPYTGSIVHESGSQPWAVSLIRNVHALHTRLLGGPFGVTVVTVTTVAALCLVVSGLIVWWREKLWRIQPRASWKRLNFDVHHTLGLSSAAVLLVIISTGVWVRYGDLDDVARKLDHVPTPVQPVQPAPDPGATVVSLDILAQAASRAVPGAAIMNIMVPASPTVPAAVQLKYPEDHTPSGRSHVYIDKYRGTVLLALNTRTAPTGQHLVDIKRALHTGDIDGVPTQILWALASLVLATQAMTGVLMWWNSRAARRAKVVPRRA